MATKPLSPGALLILLGTACGSAVTPTEPDGASASVDASVADATSSSDAVVNDASPPLPSVAEAFGSCTNPGPAGGLGGGSELIRVDLDTSVFPSAVCNDGTTALMYVRRASEATHANKWVVQLQGGGGCTSGEKCADRWCSVGTNFGAQKMSNQFAPERGTNGRGVLSNRADNPFSGWNHVFVYYCSSDSWSGTRGQTAVDAAHPVAGGAPVAYDIHFNGANIVQAVTDTLRRDGVGPVTYTDAAMNSQELPDLDDATTVVLAGASAGGGGVVHNLDWFADQLNANNTACGGASCPLEVMGIVDSSFPVSMRSLGLADTPMCLQDGFCTADAFVADKYVGVFTGLWQSRVDESCVAWNDAQATGETHWCSDKNFVLENHITTPYVLRMGLTDSLVSGNMVDAGFTVPSLGNAPLTVALFADLVAAQLNALPGAVAAGNESADVTKVPGVFGPPCPGHETLSNNAYFDVTVGTPPLTFPQLITNWYTSSGTTVAVATSIADVTGCQ